MANQTTVDASGATPDQERSSALTPIFSDEPVRDGQVSFGFEGFANTLADLALGRANQTPFTVVVKGESGCGKTTLLETTSRRLEGARRQGDRGAQRSQRGEDPLAERLEVPARRHDPGRVAREAARTVQVGPARRAAHGIRPAAPASAPAAHSRVMGACRRGGGRGVDCEPGRRRRQATMLLRPLRRVVRPAVVRVVPRGLPGRAGQRRTDARGVEP